MASEGVLDVLGGSGWDSANVELTWTPLQGEVGIPVRQCTLLCINAFNIIRLGVLITQ